MDDTSNLADGIVSDYTQMVPAPVIQYNADQNALVFNNPIIPSSGIANPTIFKNGIVIELNATDTFTPMPLPTAPDLLNIPAIASVGTIQTTDLLIAKNGSMSLYSDSSGTHFY